MKLPRNTVRYGLVQNWINGGSNSSSYLKKLYFDICFLERTFLEASLT